MQSILPPSWNRASPRGGLPTAAPASIMAVGIFALAGLPQISSLAESLAAPLTIVLLALWTGMAASYVAAVATGTIDSHARPPVGRFAIGTWIAGTEVLARLVALWLPGGGILAAIMGCIGLAVWSWFMPLAIDGFRAIAAAPDEQPASGVVLLAAVSTQSLASLAFGLYPTGSILRWPAIGLIALGYLLYAAGALLILRRYRRQKGWRLADDWDNTNCILHGAMSITGLVAVMSGALPFALCYGTWLYAAAMFLLVEAVELARLVQRWQLYGLRRGLCVYHVSQWSRNFTFGMFYAFTLAFLHAFGKADLPSAIAALQTAITAYGHYVVLALLVMETGLFIGTRLLARIRPTAPSPPQPM